MRTSRKIASKTFDAAFESEEVTKYLDLKTLKSKYPLQRINIDIPQEILARVDLEAAHIGVTRTALLKLWIAEHVHVCGNP